MKPNERNGMGVVLDITPVVFKIMDMETNINIALATQARACYIRVNWKAVVNELLFAVRERYGGPAGLDGLADLLADTLAEESGLSCTTVDYFGNIVSAGEDLRARLVNHGLYSKDYHIHEYQVSKFVSPTVIVMHEYPDGVDSAGDRPPCFRVFMHDSSTESGRELRLEDYGVTSAETISGDNND